MEHFTFKFYQYYNKRIIYTYKVYIIILEKTQQSDIILLNLVMLWRCFMTLINKAIQLIDS